MSFNEVELTVDELKALVSIIDVATQRGTFRAAELSSVGKVYDRLAAFLGKILEAERQAAAKNTNESK